MHGTTRAEAVRALRTALAATRLAGFETNLGFLRGVASDPGFRDGGCTTAHLARLRYAPRTIEVLDGGTQTSVQEHPGRLGYWAVGVPPSGPMDDLAFRLANRIAGNTPGTAALELTFTGPTLRFRTDTVVVLAGAVMDADLDGEPVPWWTAVRVAAGAVLRLGAVAGAGARTYLAVRGGFDVPRVPREPRHLRPRRLRRPRRASAARGRRAARPRTRRERRRSPEPDARARSRSRP